MRTHRHAPNAPINAKAVVSGCWLGPAGRERRKQGAPPQIQRQRSGRNLFRLSAIPRGGGTALGAEHHPRRGDVAGADVELRRSRSVWIMVLPQQKASLGVVSRQYIGHQPRQRVQGSPSPAASPEPDPLLPAPECPEPGSAPPPPGCSQENPPAPSGSFILPPSSSLPRRRHRPAACRGGPGGCSGRVPAACPPRGVQRSGPGPQPRRAQHSSGGCGKGREGTGGDRRLLPWMPVW